MLFAYNGTPFFGWQAQKGLKTVQGDLEQALLWVTRKEITLTAAGRTDRGVHAEGQVAHFDTGEPLPEEQFLCRRINSILFPNIAVRRVVEVPADFHARFSATARQYRYEWANTVDPLHHETTAVFYLNVDEPLLDTMAALLVGDHDLAGFSKESEQHATTNCSVFEAAWSRPAPGRYVFRVKANRFLHHTVRGMVATMLAVAAGKKSFSDFEKTLYEAERQRSGGTALAKGLVLEKIWFETDIFQ